MKKLLLKILNIRKYLIKKGSSYKNRLKCEMIINRIEQHLKCFPKISDESLTRYITKHQDDVLFLIPENNSGKQLKSQLLKFINHV